MNATVSTDFLLRVAQATPGQVAAFDRFLQASPEQQAAIETILAGCGAENGSSKDAENTEQRGENQGQRAAVRGERGFSYQSSVISNESSVASGEGGMAMPAEQMVPVVAAAAVVKGVEAAGAMEKSLVSALLRIEQKVDGLIASGQLPEKKKPLGEAERLQVFRLFGELLAMGTELTAPPARVFDLMVFKKLAKAEAAVACKCAASLITRRVATIEGHFGMPIEDLRTYASDIKERQSTVKGDRYAKKKHGAVRDGREQCDHRDQSSLKEDDDGYLPEERQSSD